ncbi:hypothetical protein LWC34_50125 [Kibdelosporangium philippinense]|uniref:PLD phosphodiesterase domain-containing protein n=1 Tax=Kibdelosporangium philippinense TaxID=211113 RepID=A0ABS8ZT68_9PSEU|nr:hypothetical protein [Kibdelosporangium philippinense]MCE7010910.1 hypothetical protein [Kibdelosporangium philippinense]
MGLLDRIDNRLGDGLERILCSHHARRLRKLGWDDILSEAGTGWFSPHAPVRAGCRLKMLIDGEEALPEMVEAIKGARSYVHLAGWHSSPDFRPTRGDSAQTLRELLAEAAERVPVRVLLWAGPPLPAFEPTRKRARAACTEFMRDSNVRCVLDSRERTLHCHHEKLVIVDDEIAFVGGMDFTAMEGDRHDSPKHPADRPIGWHDAVMRTEGPIVADVASHFRNRWAEVAGEELPRPHMPGHVGTSTVQFV